MPNTDSKNRKIRHVRQIKPVIILYEFTITISSNMVNVRTNPITQANFFGAALTYSGVCLLTISLPSNQTWCIFGIDENPNKKISEESDNHILNENKIFFKNDEHK